MLKRGPRTGGFRASGSDLPSQPSSPHVAERISGAADDGGSGPGTAASSAHSSDPLSSLSPSPSPAPLTTAPSGRGLGLAQPVVDARSGVAGAPAGAAAPGVLGPGAAPMGSAPPTTVVPPPLQLQPAPQPTFSSAAALAAAVAGIRSDRMDRLSSDDEEMLMCTSSSQLEMLGELGRGAFAVVHRCRLRGRKTLYACKAIAVGHLSPGHQRAVVREVMLLRRLRHPSIIRFFTSFVEGKTLYIITELASGGDLQAVIDRLRRARKRISERQLWRFLTELCGALEHMHSAGVVHRDIKAPNVFLSAEGHIKIGDLGLGRMLQGERAMMESRVGTPMYLSPELVRKQPYDFKVDVWSLGCLMYTLAALRPPFESDNLITLGHAIVNDTPPPLPSVYSEQLRTVIAAMLEKRPDRRPTVTDLAAMIPPMAVMGPPSSTAVETIDASLPSRPHSALARSRPTTAAGLAAAMAAAAAAGGEGPTVTEVQVRQHRPPAVALGPGAEAAAGGTAPATAAAAAAAAVTGRGMALGVPASLPAGAAAAAAAAAAGTPAGAAVVVTGSVAPAAAAPSTAGPPLATPVRVPPLLPGAETARTQPPPPGARAPMADGVAPRILQRGTAPTARPPLIALPAAGAGHRAAVPLGPGSAQTARALTASAPAPPALPPSVAASAVAAAGGASAVSAPAIRVAPPSPERALAAVPATAVAIRPPIAFVAPSVALQVARAGSPTNLPGPSSSASRTVVDPGVKPPPSSALSSGPVVAPDMATPVAGGGAGDSARRVPSVRDLAAMEEQIAFRRPRPASAPPVRPTAAMI